MDLTQKCREHGFRCSREDRVEGGRLVGEEPRGSCCGPQERTQVCTVELPDLAAQVLGGRQHMHFEVEIPLGELNGDVQEAV